MAVAKGLYNLIPALFASFAFATSYVFSFLCESFQFASTTTHTTTTTNTNTASLWFSPWYQSVTTQTTVSVGVGAPHYVQSHSCVAWPNGAAVDGTMKTARAFGIMVLVLGGILVIALWLTPFSYFVKERFYKCFAILSLLLLATFQGLTFVAYHSSFCNNNTMIATLSGLDSSYYSTKCTWGSGSTANVVSTLLWVFTGVAMLVIGAPKRPPRGPAETQAVTYETTVAEGGTTRVVETNVVKGTVVSTKPEEAFNEA